ncbi:hypothetical protein COT98_02365 [Candidatus Falkowbacteria bacterium CG10_big_fil_rev_8_21_14_0_10_39_9]|uniref:Uncharacterized protein n=1 Tax=Candidatus Falkowbacteria bacterium CG10_big_fil_rev_8_21_14_0_10_39_9 TaxID=1974566 RepID=A0A2M6WPL2_9BACT|nr:MAG: hypothetical protein COT98_02365 [Candidatus Falkowbacteria bacterium CG10_big_fil_rev_8_21_14_0_10_39_9]
MEKEKIEPLSNEDLIKLLKDSITWLYIFAIIFTIFGVLITFVPPKNEQDTQNGLKYIMAAILIGTSFVFVVVAHRQKQKIKEKTSKPE